MKRTLQVSIVKKPKDTAEPDPDDDIEFDNKVLIASAAVSNVIRQAGKAVLSYVAADTLRQVIVKSMTKK